jgi:hypothetical protein
MRVTARLLRGVDPATGMAWLDRPNFFSHCAWRQYQPNGTVPWRLRCPAYAKSFRPKNAERRRTNSDPVRVHLCDRGSWRQYQPNGTVPWRLRCPAYAKSFRPKNAERRRTNSIPVRVHLLRIGAPDCTRPRPRDDGSKRLPIWAVTRSPHLTRRFESQLVGEG